MSIRVTNLRASTIFREGREIYQVIKYEHQKMGRGKAVIKVRARNLRAQAFQELTYKSGQSVQEVSVATRTLTFIFYGSRRDQIMLADPVTQKRTLAPGVLLSERQRSFLKEGTEAQAIFLEDEVRVICLQIPLTVELKVVETTASEKGDTAGSARKPACLESGAVVQVPMFIRPGDKIRVNTESGSYIERA